MSQDSGYYKIGIGQTSKVVLIMDCFVVLEKKERGAPVEFTGATLYDRLIIRSKELDHGYKPWYQSRGLQINKVFEDEMFLIVKEKLISY